MTGSRRRRTRNTNTGRGYGNIAGLGGWRAVGAPIRGWIRRETFYSPTQPIRKEIIGAPRKESAA